MDDIENSRLTLTFEDMDNQSGDKHDPLSISAVLSVIAKKDAITAVFSSAPQMEQARFQTDWTELPVSAVSKPGKSALGAIYHILMGANGPSAFTLPVKSGEAVEFFNKWHITSKSGLALNLSGRCDSAGNAITGGSANLCLYGVTGLVWNRGCHTVWFHSVKDALSAQIRTGWMPDPRNPDLSLQVKDNGFEFVVNDAPGQANRACYFKTLEIFTLINPFLIQGPSSR